jgi:hypothetical protein
MEKYENTDNFRLREHIVELTLQSGESKGTLKKIVTGNCFGQDVLYCFDVETFDDGESFLENNCELEIFEDDNGDYWFTCTLKDNEGNEHEIEMEISELKNMVVKLEIIDCKIINK